MGSPISPVLADLVMEEIEETAISTFPYPPKWWFRYVDDSHSYIKKDQVDNFHKHLNSINPNMQFTLELENTNGQGLPFIDTIPIRRDTKIQVDVYRKPTHTDRYLDFFSCHPMCHKRSVVNTLLKRANNIPSTNKGRRREEIQRVKTVLRDNNYPMTFIRNCERELFKQPAQTNFNGFVVLPRKKSGVCDKAKGTNTSKEESKNTGKSPKKPRRLVKRFGEMSEEDVLKLKHPEHLDYNLDILFVGINPGLMPAYKGHPYAGANNHFWPCLYESGLVPERLTYLDDVRCPSYGIGLTNMVERTRGSADLSRQEMRDGKGELIRKVELYKPLIVCFNGKVIYELFSGSKCTVGRQKDPIPGTNTTLIRFASTSSVLDCLSKLLGINRENLEEKLVSVFVETRRGGRVEITKKTNNKCQAVAARDTLSKALYSHLFDYLVQVINGALKKYKDYLSIGILDIYGFESFKENSFDQFAINYMNEKLHQVCVGFTFTIEQEEYIREGITWKTVDYFNNKIVCELIESKRPSGIMSALDEVCCSVKSKKEGLERTLIQVKRKLPKPSFIT
ncbi:uncharacterized protein LOC111325104 [Stylophora pistillata]|uniref:uncharacterized protein LOC111325104 n=1 Tax=Stylophora pistillata TaxID=50429 RepID=UPI000C03BF5F|nr:uncharacterized protein LOC111325104 [Stylophora pistillata]